MSRLLHKAASRVLSDVARLLPSHLSAWARAMARELDEIEDGAAALLFAFGCVRSLLLLAIAERLAAATSATDGSSSQPAFAPASVPERLWASPRNLGLLCGGGAVAAGMAYMFAGGAPRQYLLVNLAALILGALAWEALGRASSARLRGAGVGTLLLSLSLILTAAFGVSVDGASRWISVGPISLQVSLLVLPLMIVLYARSPDMPGTCGLVLAALALAAQPDAAMAGVLAAGLLPLTLARRNGPALAACAAAICAFAWCLLTPDTSSPGLFVDRVLYDAFELDLIAGMGVLLGAVALIVPAAAGIYRGTGDSASLLAFGGCWAGVVVAAAFGNYPTPLVGYGGSAVLGYLLSVSLLPAYGGKIGRGDFSAPHPAEWPRGGATPSEFSPARQL